jgi:hypothetical protein
MAAITNALNEEEILRHGYDEHTHRYVIVHPLDDIPEEKIDTDTLGPMPMTAAVRWSLLSLRAYLILMIVMVFYHVLQLAGLFGGGH